MKKCAVTIEAMASANFSRDVLEIFYGEILQQEGLPQPIRPHISLGFEVARNEFNDWLRVWKMRASEGNKDIFKFFQETKNSFIHVTREEAQDLGSAKVQFGLLVRFSVNRNEEVEHMEHYFNRMKPIVINEHNIDTLNHVFNQFVEEVRGEIENWSERGSGWVVDEILEAFINVARYQPLRGGTYMPLPEKLKNKKAIINIKNRDNMCLRWAIRAHLFPARSNVDRASSYPTNDGLNFEGIDFPTPVSQIDRLERQNPNLAINVFGWDKEQVIVYRISEQGGNIPRINLMLTHKGDNTHYSYVKRLTALLYDQNHHNDSKHFCERCLHGYSRKELLERHKQECKGLLKTATRTEVMKEGENKMSFTNFYKQMKAPYVIYADFECILEKIAGCEPSADKSFTVKTEKHEPCGFSYIAVRSDGKLFGPFNYRGREAVYVFLKWMQNHEKEMREDMADKRPLVMTPEDWQKHRGASDCHICCKSLVKGLYLDSMAVYDYESGKYCGQSHRRCYHQAAKNKYTPQERRQPKDAIDIWIEKTQETCLFCAEPLLVPNFKDSVRDHDHMTGKYRGATHNECNLKLKLNAKTMPIPVIFHNLKGYDGHLLMQAMASVQGEIKCIPTNTEKYMSFSLGNLRFIDSLNFMQSSLDKLVKGSEEFPIMEKMPMEENKRKEDKEKYIVHYRNLQLYLRQGMRLKKVHRVLEFDQERWMELYIRMNTEFRKQAKSDFETNFYKLMNNSVFGKTMENLQNRVDVKIVRRWEVDQVRKLISDPSYSRFALFSNDMAGIHMHKRRLVLNKPVYTGMTILENSKILMYEFFYDFLKTKYGPWCDLIYTDTDSLLLHIQTDDVYEDMKEHKRLYDTSNYPKDHSLYDATNKKALGKMKDECGGEPIEEVVVLRPKMYSIKKAEGNIKKAKGVKKNVIEREITHEHYKEALFGRKEYMHKMNILRSEDHEMYGMCMNKTSISPFDTKRWIAGDGVHTLAYGHRAIRPAGAEY